MIPSLRPIRVSLQAVCGPIVEFPRMSRAFCHPVNASARSIQASNRPLLVKPWARQPPSGPPRTAEAASAARSHGQAGPHTCVCNHERNWQRIPIDAVGVARGRVSRFDAESFPTTASALLRSLRCNSDCNSILPSCLSSRRPPYLRLFRNQIP